MIDAAVRQLEAKIKDDEQTPPPIVIRLSGDVHTNDRLAMREIGRQLFIQNVASDLEVPPLDEDDDADELAGEEDIEATRVPTTLVRISVDEHAGYL